LTYDVLCFGEVYLSLWLASLANFHSVHVGFCLIHRE